MLEKWPAHLDRKAVHKALELLVQVRGIERVEQHCAGLLLCATAYEARQRRGAVGNQRVRSQSDSQTESEEW